MAVRVIRASAAALLLCGSGAAAAETQLRLQATATTDYVYRGITQTRDGPALQGSVELALTQGVYAGVWVGQVDYEYDDRDREVDYYVGYQHRMSTALAVDLTLIRYTYDAAGYYGVDQDWTELQATLHLRDRWSAMFAVARDWWGRDASTYVTEVTYRHPFPFGVVGDATIGYNRARNAIGDDYRYAEAGIARSFGPLSGRLGYVTSAGAGMLDHVAPSQWLASLTWQFETPARR